LDRFVYWQKERPTKEQLKNALEDYIGIPGAVSWDDSGGRFLVDLPGTPGSPIKRLLSNHQHEYDGKRWFELYIADDNIDVITRQADEFTNTVAAGFAQFCKRFWDGRTDQ